jgi:GNAT superfamily N-acetyltransferase
VLISKLHESQIDTAAAVLVRAFFDSPVWTWLAPDEAKRSELMPWFMRTALRHGLWSGETYVIGDPMAGVAMWDPPGKLDADLDADAERDAKPSWDELPARMDPEALARFNAMNGTQGPVHERVSGGAPMWYLSLIGVEPAAQRAGAGTALLRDMFARTDGAGVPCMTETAKEANVPYYERHGFVVAHSGAVPLGGPRFWTMLRDPARA